jgi:peroxiredoxin family protein
MEEMPAGARLRVCASDLGFAADIAAWCNSTGNKLVEIGHEGKKITAVIEKSQVGTGCPPEARSHDKQPAAPSVGNKKTIIVFSGDLDRVMASFIIANGAAATGSQVTMFFTFWGLNALRRPEGVPASPRGVRVEKGLLDRMFGWMMPRGAGRLKLSKMNMAGVGTAMMKHVMKQKKVASLPELIRMARQAGVRLVACTMTMDVMGIDKEELIEGLDFGGVATYLEAADASNVNLFI